MSNDQDNSQQGAANDQPQQQPRDFQDEPWQVLIGLRREGTDRVIVGMSADPTVMVPPHNRPDKTNPAVYFALWLDRNMAALQAMAQVEYTQYCNLRRLTENASAPPVLALVDTEGQRLGSGTTQ